MLTPEQERERALKISQLYFSVTKREAVSVGERSNLFDWSLVVKYSILLAMPFVVANVIFTLFLNSQYGFAADVGSAGIVFILAILVAYYFTYKTLKFVFNGFYETVFNYRAIFWLSLLFLLPTFFLLRNLIIGDSLHEIFYLVMRVGVHGTVFALASIGFVALLTYIIEKMKTTDAVRIKLAIGLTAVPYAVAIVQRLTL